MPVSTVPIVPSTMPMDMESIPTHAPSPRLDVPMMFQREIPSDIPNGPRDAREGPSRFPQTTWTDVVAIIDEFGLAWATMIERVVGRHRLIPIVVDCTQDTPAMPVVTTMRAMMSPRAALDNDDFAYPSVKPLRRISGTVGVKPVVIGGRDTLGMHVVNNPGFASKPQGSIRRNGEYVNVTR